MVKYVDNLRTVEGESNYKLNLTLRYESMGIEWD